MEAAGRVSRKADVGAGVSRAAPLGRSHLDRGPWHGHGVAGTLVAPCKILCPHRREAAPAQATHLRGVPVRAPQRAPQEGPRPGRGHLHQALQVPDEGYLSWGCSGGSGGRLHWVTDTFSPPPSMHDNRWEEKETLPPAEESDCSPGPRVRPGVGGGRAAQSPAPPAWWHLRSLQRQALAHLVP